MISFKITYRRFYTKYLYEKISENLFFNSFLDLAIKGFIELIIFGILNSKTATFKINGEILGFSFGAFSLFLSGSFLPIIIVVLLIIYNKE